MKISLKIPDTTLEHIEQSVLNRFPKLKPYYHSNISGRYLIIPMTESLGIGIWIKGSELKLQEIIPSSKRAMLISSLGFVGMLIVKAVYRKKWKKFKSELFQHLTHTFQ